MTPEYINPDTPWLEATRAVKRAWAKADAERYRCALCKGTFARGEIAVDHIVPVIDPVIGFRTWDEYITRLFCPVSNLQVVCKVCHKAKSNAENKIRRAKGKK